MARQLHLGAFMRPVAIHTGAWRYPGAWPDANFNFAHLRHLARRLEERVHTVERIIAADDPDWRPSLRHEREDDPRIDYRQERSN